MLDTGQLSLRGEALSWFREGLAAAAADEYERAIFYFDRVLRNNPDFDEAWYERGMALDHWGDYAEAIASFDKALSLTAKPDRICQIWCDRGNALQYGLGDYVAAVACYDRVLQINPDHELALQNRGNALLYGLNAPEEALRCYSRALHLTPENSITWRNRGNALVDLQRFEEAIASYDRALAINPDDEVAWHARNHISEQSGLNDRQPTTNPAWHGGGGGFTAPTRIDSEPPAKPVDHSTYIQSFDDCPAVKMAQPFLVVEDDWGKREVILDREHYLIGRDPKSDICLHSQFASRHHATLIRSVNADGMVFYQIRDGDLSGKLSTNGLMINGQKQRSCQLKPEDTVVFGPQVRVIYRLAPAP